MEIKYKVLVCGGRDFEDYEFLEKSLLGIFRSRNISQNNLAIIHGDARGADSFADRFADYYGLDKDVYRADWKLYGKSAGYVRNKQMLDEGKPNLVVAFYGGKGTDMMCKIAKEAGVEVIRFNHDTTVTIIH